MSQENDLSLEVQFTFWPSIAEISESTSTHRYVGGLKEHFDSLAELTAKLKDRHIQVNDVEDKTFAENLYPEALASFLLFIGSTGIAAGLYNLLRTWVDSKNGRKIRVKIGALEVETSQMTEEQFFNFLKKVKEYEDSQMEADSFEDMLAVRKKYYEYFQNANYNVLHADSVEYASEEHQVTLEAHKSIRRVRALPGTLNSTQKAVSSKKGRKALNPKPRKNKKHKNEE